MLFGPDCGRYVFSHPEATRYFPRIQPAMMHLSSAPIVMGRRRHENLADTPNHLELNDNLSRPSSELSISH